MLKIERKLSQLYNSNLEIAPGIGHLSSEKVKNRFYPAKLSICRTFCPAEDFYCHIKWPVIKCICRVVISMKATFVRQKDYKAK